MNNIEAAAQYVATAAAHARTTAERLAAAEAERGRIQARLADQEAERSHIVSRRQHGQIEPDDGAKLALLQADREGLLAILAETDVNVTLAREPHQDAKRALAAARDGLRQVEDTTIEAALVEHATGLDQLLVETIRRFREVHQRIGRGTPIWGPSRTLMDALRRLSAERHEL